MAFACRVCGCPVHGPEDGAAFRAGSIKFVVCATHAPLVATGGQLVGGIARKMLRAYLTDKFPNVVEAFDEVQAQQRLRQGP